MGAATQKNDIGPSDKTLGAASPARVPALYDPGLVAKLGLLFTPAFAAWFAMRNWLALGQEAQAARQKRWFIAGLGFLAGSVGLGYSSFAVAEMLFNIAFVAFLLLWYVGPQKKQREWVRAHCSDKFPERSLLVPSLCAGAVCVVVLASMMGAAMQKAAVILEKTGFNAMPAADEAAPAAGDRP